MAREAPRLSAMIGSLRRDLDRLHARARDQARHSRRPAVVSFTVAAEAMDPVALFDGAAILAQERALWCAPGGSMALVALGAAAVLEAGGGPGGRGPADAGTRPPTGPGEPDEPARPPGRRPGPAEGGRPGLPMPRPGGAGDHPAAGAGPLAGPAAAVASAWQALCEGALIDAPHGVWGTGPVLVGGFAFDPAAPAGPEWAGFPAARFVLPELLVTRVAGGTWLTFNRVVVPGPVPASEQGAEWAFPGGVRLSVPPAAMTLAGERGGRWLALLAVASGARAGAAGGGAGGSGAATGAPSGGAGGPGASAGAVAAGARAYGEAGSSGGNVRAVALPGRAGWREAVEAALAAIAGGELEKVVLARRLYVRAGSAFDPGTVLRRLQADYPECFVFAVARDRAVFLGATPERLVRLRDGRLETAAVAGSTARGTTPEADAALGRALLESPKEREEHGLVVRMLRETLAPVCRVLHVPPEPRLLPLRNVQHLYTPITGVVDGVTLPELVARLHPTPALGGWPREAALAFIRRWEGGARGWYAAPVGWFDHRGGGEMAVAIRSGLLRGAEAWLFAGCGLVAGSDPEREWQETALKLRPLAAALGVQPGTGEVGCDG
ncbi:isochorismate synthase [Thermaerobacter marianensis DSM 12885]|uniref:isochorismate synthase n=1 Tax=Thermaerobacter marianensis (strain ATCC 700841 / DSM 12885 / JCM 10246 / 7p75a) TaxID=644966 RepID=E6SH69_THEM7|nr:isochorismate synthase [Thermaerobacter marianensis DSM 12885]